MGRCLGQNVLISCCNSVAKRCTSVSNAFTCFRGNILIEIPLQVFFMSEVDIPRHVWESFLETFSERHAGWLVQVETHDRQTDETVASQIAALHSIELDLEDAKNPRINVTVLYDTKQLK